MRLTDRLPCMNAPMVALCVVLMRRMRLECFLTRWRRLLLLRCLRLVGGAVEGPFVEQAEGRVGLQEGREVRG